MVGEWSAARLRRATPQKERRYPLNRRLGEPRSWSGRFREGINLLPLVGNRSKVGHAMAQAVSCRPVDVDEPCSIQRLSTADF